MTKKTNTEKEYLRGVITIVSLSIVWGFVFGVAATTLYFRWVVPCAVTP